MAKDKQGKRGPKTKSKQNNMEQTNNDNSSSVAGSSKSEMYDESDNKNLFKTKRSYIKVENKKRDELI